MKDEKICKGAVKEQCKKAYLLQGNCFWKEKQPERFLVLLKTFRGKLEENGSGS